MVTTKIRISQRLNNTLTSGTLASAGINGNDDNYGFNKNDAIKTFDGALIRVQNQSTINPIKTIYIKAAPLIHEGSPTVFAAVKNLDIVTIQNVKILITVYDTDNTKKRARIRFEGDPSGHKIAMLGQIKLLGSVNLCFRDVDLICNNANIMPANPTNLSLFGLQNTYGNICFESSNGSDLGYSPFGNIYLNEPYFIFEASLNNALLNVKFVNIAVIGGSGLSSLFSIYQIGVDCTQINGTLPTPYYGMPNMGWYNSIIIRNNF